MRRSLKRWVKDDIGSGRRSSAGTGEWGNPPRAIGRSQAIPHITGAKLGFDNGQRVIYIYGQNLNYIKSTSYDGFVVVELRTTRWRSGKWAGIMRIEGMSSNVMELSLRGVGDKNSTVKLDRMLSGAYRLNLVASGVGAGQVLYTSGLPVGVEK